MQNPREIALTAAVTFRRFSMYSISHLPSPNCLERILGFLLHGSPQHKCQLSDVQKRVLVGRRHIHAVELYNAPIHHEDGKHTQKKTNKRLNELLNRKIKSKEKTQTKR